MRVLLSSVSKKIPLIHQVKAALNRFSDGCSLVGGDLNPECIGAYFCDDFLKMRSLDTYTFDTLLEDLKSKQVTHIIPTRDGELSFYASHKIRLKEHGIDIMVSDEKELEKCLDKYLFYQTMRAAIIPTYLELNQDFANAYVVKERRGHASQGIGVALSYTEARDWGVKLREPIYQPYIEGEEHSIDIYIDVNRELKGFINRSRDLVVGGESQVTTLRDSKEVEPIVRRFVQEFSLYGHVMIQAIKDSQGVFHIIECNPRFGGASTLSIRAGLDSFYWFFSETNGKCLQEFKPKASLKMIRYAEDLFIE